MLPSVRHHHDDVETVQCKCRDEQSHFRYQVRDVDWSTLEPLCGVVAQGYGRDVAAGGDQEEQGGEAGTVCHGRGDVAEYKDHDHAHQADYACHRPCHPRRTRVDLVEAERFPPTVV